MSEEARPRLSVVVPTHETRALTLACLRALEASRGVAPFEVVVVDDASQDGTAGAIAAAHPRVKVVRLEANRGFTVAVNTGVADARGDTLLLLNSDTEVAPDALARLVSALDADPRVGAAGAALVYPDGTPQWSAGREPSLAWLFVSSAGLAELARRLPGYARWRARARGEAGADDHAPRAVGWVPGAAVAIRRRAWDEVGGFDASFALYAQDLDLCVRLRRAGWGVALVPDARVVHHLGATIGALPEASANRAQTALLWCDLVRWASKTHGVAFGRAAKGALLVGARLRLVLAALGAVDAETRALAAHRAAMKALSAFDVRARSAAR